MVGISILAAVVVRALTLPLHATIDPYGSRPLIVAAPNGTVAATVTVRGFSTRAVEWDTAGRVREVPPARPGSSVDDYSTTLAGFDRASQALVDFTSSGSSNLTRYQALRASPAGSSEIDVARCPFPQGSAGATIAGTYDDASLIGTMMSPPLIDVDDRTGQTAPVAFRIRSNLCMDMGNGIVVAAAGFYAAGYLGFNGSVPAQSNVGNPQRWEALRWHDGTRSDLGPGAALAIAANGDAVGSDSPPGIAFDGTPHARRWDADGSAFDLVAHAHLSVAYAIDDRGRVLGMLQDDSGRHYAFLWSRGIVYRLDDVIDAPDWRFQSAYAFAPGGHILGIGLHDGVAAVFDIEGL